MDKTLVLEIAKMSGCDIDGDIIFIDGKGYHVHILQNIVEEFSFGLSMIFHGMRNLKTLLFLQYLWVLL